MRPCPYQRLWTGLLEEQHCPLSGVGAALSFTEYNSLHTLHRMYGLQYFKE